MLKTQSFSPRLFIGVAAVALILVIGVGCSSKGTSPSQPQAATEAIPLVQALPGSRAEMEIPRPDGTLPCGLAQIEWGYQIFQMDDFPACDSLMPNVTVYCLDGEAQWTGEALTIVNIVPASNTITIDSQREGICGVFPSQE